MVKRWEYKRVPPQDQIDELSSSINVNPYLSGILLQRHITSFAEAKDFFRPSLENLHDPFLMKNMHHAVERLHRALEKHERIVIYGDYDVDGTTSVALVYSYLRTFYEHCAVYIPDRYAEGYGVSQAGIEWAASNEYTLIIALDCGIKASDMVTLANGKGIDFIICDHHMPDHNIPNAVAVLDPKQDDCNYPYKELSGCGLGFKLIQAYAQRHRVEKDVYNYLDLVAVSIASDIVPITGENRILAHFGLKKLNENPSPGLKALKEIAAIRNKLDISGIVFTLGPRINAAGRVAHASAAVDLLIAQTEEEAFSFAEKVNLRNTERRQFDLDITEEAIAMIEGDDLHNSTKSTVLFKNTWHKGVIGIVAARCVEKFYRPTVILTESNNKITGSARSVSGFDLYKAIFACGDLLEKFGGHKYAAGLTLDHSNLDAFRTRFEEVVSSTITEDLLTPTIEVDSQINFDAITQRFFNVLKQMAPFGPENPKPVFEAKGVFVHSGLNNFKERHLRFLAGQQGKKNVMNAIGFDMAHHYERIVKGDPFKMIFTIEENTYNGNTSIQLRIRDIKFD